MFAQCIFVRKKNIQRPIEAVVIDLFLGNAKKIITCCFAILRIRYLQYRRRGAESGETEHCCHCRSGNIFSASRDMLFAEFLKPQSLPKRKAEVDIFKMTKPFLPVRP
jgi:hypothetical protein